ncbi:hypothetical protein SAMN02910292_03030 [Lachnospiraceae bacterium XBB2008]|nr:hypothetical protein SAMN02910292_03030 [Lachnospiraceae bacterium XBB2008]
MPDVTLNVSSKIARLLENQSYAELVFRESNRRFDFFSKAVVTNTSSNVASDSLINSVESLSAKNMRSIFNKLDNGIDTISTRLNSVDSATKMMAINVDKLIKQTRATNVLSFLGVGLSLVNIGVDIIGFKMVSEKLNELSAELKDVKAAVAQLYNATVSEKLSDCEKLIMRFNAISDHIQNGEVMDLNDLQNLLIDMNGYLSEMMRDLVNKVFDLEDILQIILRILPAYSILLSEFVKRYYFKYSVRPNNYDTFLNMYSEFFQQTISDTLMDHLLLQQKTSYMDAMDTINIIKLLALNERTKVEDQINLAEALQTEEAFKQVDIELAELAQRGELLSA